MRSVFVTGTGTGVGKTVVTAAICVCSGANAMKPAQTGASRPLDLDFVARVTGRTYDAAIACPYIFDEPVAPAVAARRAGARIDLDVIVERFHAMHTPVVVEGAGGLLVPLNDDATMADLALALGLPLVIVCRPGLGTLNETALTVEAARSRGIEIVGLVVSGAAADPDLAERTNRDELARIAPLAGSVPRVPGLDVDAGDPGDLASLAAASLSPELGGTWQGG